MFTLPSLRSRLCLRRSRLCLRIVLRGDHRLVHPPPPRLWAGSGVCCRHHAEANRLAHMHAPCPYAGTESRMSFRPHCCGKCLQSVATTKSPGLVALDWLVRLTFSACLPRHGPSRHVLRAKAQKEYCANLYAFSCIRRHSVAGGEGKGGWHPCCLLRRSLVSHPMRLGVGSGAGVEGSA